MGTPTQVYVDPAIAGNSGSGTIGDPYGDLQYALNTVTRDSTNGDQFNIKAGTDEALAAAIDLTTYGTPTQAARLFFRGYTAVANDGGIGGISGAGSFSVFNSTTLDFISFVDLHCHNTGSNTIIRGDQSIQVLNCEINNTTGIGVQVGFGSLVQRCHVHNCGAAGISIESAGLALDNFLKNGTNDFTAAIDLRGTGSVAENNIISVDGSSIGIRAGNNFGQVIKNNSIYSSGGTGDGISVSTNRRDVTIENNIIEGFSGVGGEGLNLPAATSLVIYGHNKYYNNATNETLTGDVYINLGNNSVLGASPFTNPVGDDFSVGTSVKAGAYPSSFKGSSTNQYLDVGAAQREEPAGSSGGGPIFGGMVIR